MKIPDLKKAIEGIDFQDEENKTLKVRLGEIKDSDSLNEFYKKWKTFLKKTYLSLHPDKNPGKEGDFKDFREKAELINKYIDIFTKNDNGKREFKDTNKQEAFLKSTKAINAINVSDFSNLDSGVNKDSPPSAKNSSRRASSSEPFKSFEDLCREIDWDKIIEPEPQKKASWFAIVDDSGKLVVINSDGKKDLNSKILEKAELFIHYQNPNVNDRIEVESKSISGVIVIISKEEMAKKIAQNSDNKVDDKKTPEEIKVPLDLDYGSSRPMIGKYDEKSLPADEKKSQSYADKHPSNKGHIPRASENTNTGSSPSR